jgi:hypothetical protein
VEMGMVNCQNPNMSILIHQENVYVVDRGNQRMQVFSPC